MLSSPNLVTMPGTQAKFLVGGEIPYIIPTGLNAVNVQFKEYGVKLDLTPTILPDGGVETKITPEVSDLDFQNGIQVAGYMLPSFKTSRITTDVVTKAGESIVMAGLLRRQELKNIDKIPGLGRSADPGPAVPLDPLPERRDRRRLRHDPRGDHPMNVFLALLRDERGAALTEYALVLTVIAAASIVALYGLSGQLSKTLQNLADTLFAAQTGP